MMGAAKALHPLYHDRAAPRALDFRAQVNEEVCQIRNFRLTRGVFQHCLTVSQHCSHE